MQHVPVAEVLERRLFLDAVPAGPKFFVNDPRAGAQQTPAVAADAAGNFVVAWEANRQVWTRRFDAAGNPRAPEMSLGLGSRPAVAMDADGDFVVAWQQGELQFFELPKIRAARFSSSGVGQSLGQVVTTPHPGAETSPAVAMSPGGDFVITWTSDFRPDNEYAGQKTRVYARLYDAAGQPRGSDFRVSVIERDTEWRLKSAVAMDADGNFAVTWYQLAPQLPWELTTRRFTAAGAPLEEPVVLDRGLFPNIAPGLAMDADGDFVVLWQKGNSESSGEWFWRRYDDARGAWGATTPLAPGEAGAKRPAIDIDADGNFVITWADGVDFDVFVYAQCFTPAGEKSGERIVVEAQDYDDPVNPAVAMDEQGNLIVAWDQWSGSGSWDVLARRYTGAAVPQAPRVTAVMVGGTAWSIRYLYGLEARGLGSRRWGFAVPSGAEQERPLPWVNLNQVTVRFDRDVTVPADALVVTGAAGAAYPLAASGEAPAFAYDAGTRTATWTFGRSIGADRLSVTLRSGAGGVRRAAGGRALDGEWLGAADNWPSGDGADGGDFRLALGALPGDVTRDGRVNADDVLAVRRARWAEVDDPRWASGFMFRDVNGDNRVILSDELSIRRSIGRSLPPTTQEAATARPRRIAPLTRGFFGDSPILV